LGTFSQPAACHGTLKKDAMKPNQRISFASKAVAAAAAAVLACAGGAAQTARQLPDAPSPLLRGPGNILIERAAPGPLSLTLDDAISRALANNAQLKVDEQSVRMVQGQTGTAF